MLQHNDLLCLFKFFRSHNDSMAVLNSYLLFQRSAQDPMLTGNRHNEFRTHISSLILLIFQNMVNRSTCPMAALQIPCFLLTVHMVFRHMIRCRSRDLLFIQNFCDGACSVAPQYSFVTWCLYPALQSMGRSIKGRGGTSSFRRLLITICT